MLKEEEVAIDIVQDVFVNLWKAKETIESGLHLKMFIYQSMRHRCLNYIRIKKLEENYQNEYKLLASEEGFADMVVEEEVYRIVMKEIDELPGEQRKVIPDASRRKKQHRDGGDHACFREHGENPQSTGPTSLKSKTERFFHRFRHFGILITRTPIEKNFKKNHILCRPPGRLLCI